MQEPWEIFYGEWRARAALPTGARQRMDPQRLAAAVSAAAQQTTRHLRERWDWSLVNSHILVGRFVEAADQWLLHGSDPGQLRYWLHAVWTAERTLCSVEQARRRNTDAVLAGVAAPGVRVRECGRAGVRECDVRRTACDVR